MKKGFTLVELLVVISIITILSGIVLANFASSKSRARDARRIADITQFQVALESYFKDYNPASPYTYPSALSSLAPNYISVIQKDPQTNANYAYQASTTGKAYCIGATLENSTNKVITENTTCSTGFSWCTLTSNYKVCRQ